MVGQARQSVDELVNDAVGRLRSAGRRMTASRRAFLRCLFQEGSHRTAEELAQQMQTVTPDIHLSTIYRNLEELERLGIIEHVHLGHGPATYHLTTEDHGHLVCELCGSVYEVPDGFFDELAKLALESVGMRISPHHFAVLGVCERCCGKQTGNYQVG